MTVNRDRLKKEYKELFFELQGILFSHDLMGINFETNTDEYDPELGTILPRLKTAKNTIEVSNLIAEEFEKWFDSEEANKIPRSAYDSLATEIWAAWRKYNL